MTLARSLGRTTRVSGGAVPTTVGGGNVRVTNVRRATVMATSAKTARLDATTRHGKSQVTETAGSCRRVVVTAIATC